MVRIALNPVLAVQPRQDLLEELSSVTLSDTELGDPDGLVEGLVEVDEVVLEVVGVVPGVVVGHDEVNLAVAAAIHEALEPVDALASLVTVGHRGGADAETLLCQWLDVLAVSSHCVTHRNVGTSTTNESISM